MTSSSSLYGQTQTTGSVSSSNMTTLYSGGNAPAPNGNLVIPGTLTVNGCAILTNCSSFSLLPTNAESILFGGAATSLLIGSGSGTTTIQNQLATANYTFPVADGVTGQVLVTDGSGTLSFAAVTTVGKTYNIDASTTTGGVNFNLTSDIPTTDTIKFANGTNMNIVRTDANTITFNTTADNIPDGTAKGQILYWDGSAWTANNVITSAASADRLTSVYENSTAGNSSALLVRKDYGSTNYSSANNDGVGISYSLDSDSQGISNYGFVGFEYSATAPQFIVASSLDNFSTNTQLLIVDSNGAAVTGDLDVRGGNITNTTGALSIAPGTSSLLTLVSDNSNPVYIERDSTATNLNVRSLALNVQSSGTPTAGFGNSLEFQVEAQPGNTERAGNISVTSTDLTAGSEDFDFTVNLMNNGAAAAERFRVNSYGGTTITRYVPDTNISTTGLTLKATSSGTTAVGFGTSFDMSLELPSGTTSRTSYIDNVITDGTVGSEDVSMSFGLMYNGTTSTRMQLASTGILSNYGNKILGSTSGSSQFTAPATGSTLTYILPGSAGAANTVLTNDGSGNLSWALPGGGGSTFGNVTVGVATDNTVSTTTGDLVLASATNNIDASSATINVGSLSVDNQSSIDTNTLTTTSTSTVALMTTTRNAMTGLVNIIQGANVHCVNFTALRVDATTAMLTTYGEMYNTTPLANFTANVSGGALRLLITPTSATSTVFSAVRTSLT